MTTGPDLEAVFRDKVREAIALDAERQQHVEAVQRVDRVAIELTGRVNQLTELLDYSPEDVQRILAEVQAESVSAPDSGDSPA